MLVLTSNPAYQAFSIRPVNKGSDGTIIRRIFRTELYGDDSKAIPDESLLNIYDKMENQDIWGAYLVLRGDHVLFLLEVHPPLQMDLTEEYPLRDNDIGIYCFFDSFREPDNDLALRACLETLLNRPDMTAVITSIGHGRPDEPKAILLRKAGFVQRPESTDTLSIYECTREAFQGIAPKP
jgi:hypothetical protein